VVDSPIVTEPPPPTEDDPAPAAELAQAVAAPHSAMTAAIPIHLLFLTIEASFHPW
jgi:hypothetical protein